MYPQGIHKTGQPHRISLPVRWLVALFVCLLVFGTALIFSGLATFAATPWTITPSSTLTAGDVNCPLNANGSWTCSIKLQNPFSPGPGVRWTANTKAKAGPHGLAGVTFTPSSGILSGGEATPIMINIPRTASACQNGFFRFTDPTNTRVFAQATWTCTFIPVVMVVSPTSLQPPGDPNCTTPQEITTCTVTLADPAYSTNGFNWKATSNTSPVTINPPFGTLSPNESTPVTLSFFCGIGTGTVTFTAKSLPPTGGRPTPPPSITVTITTNCP